ncbi:polycystic kidney disease and receptor for egg jelly-related protein-like [Cervus elaphus]|uniref:polycystic kidney disease and receptor for egg jelly-related protein-like n=1 Tax=Cervus elaphus TaxID=9860 RepID=UPI001CC30671|nr:polycystic kidney disease and receptor for egg jelly-related protein-like [Cervus elaphus]
MVLTQLHCMAMEPRTLAGAHTDGAQQEGPMPRCPGDLPASGPWVEGLIALPPAHQATSGMRVRGRSAEGGLRVPDSRTSATVAPEPHARSDPGPRPGRPAPHTPCPLALRPAPPTQLAPGAAMGPGPALLLLGLGLGLGCGPGRQPPPPAPPQAPGSPSRDLPVLTPASARRSPSETQALVQARGPEAALRSVRASRDPGERGAGFGGLGAGRARVSLRARAAPGGGILLSGRRGLCLPAGRPAGLAPRCLRAHVQLRARGAAATAPAPAPVDLQLSAPGGRLSLRWLSHLPRSLGPLEWTFRLGLLGPAAAEHHALPRRALHRARRSYPGFVARTECPTDGPTPVVLEAVSPNRSERAESSVSCQVTRPSLCKLDPVRINRNDDKPVRLTRDMGDTFNATVNLFCPLQQYYLRMWYIYPVPYVGAVPDWSKPLRNPPVKLGRSATLLIIPPYSFTWGIYLFNLTVVVKTRDPRVPGQSDSDSIYVVIYRRPLNAVISGPSNITVNFTDGVTLNGNMSSDPEETDPLERERLKFLWYCTTDSRDYDGENITVISKEVCLPEQVDLKWTLASGPILTLSPGTLQGGRVYFFRLVIQKTGRSAFADATLHVLQGAPVASISCIENCDQVLVLSERFSLSLDCTGCTAGRDVYWWSILTSSGQEVPFDWTGQTSTGRNGAYMSIKDFAFWNFREDKFWISLNAATWSGVTLALRYPFVIHHVPVTTDCKIVPEKGISFITKFVVICTCFKDKNIVLTYKIIVPDVHGFGEISSLKENNFGSVLYLGKNCTSPPSFLPVGVLDSHYALKIIAQAYNTSLGAFSQVNLYATVWPPTDANSSLTVLEELSNFTMGPNSSLSALLQQQDFLNASYLIYVIASVLNNMKTNVSLQAEKIKLREHLFNQTLILPINTLVNISQVVMAVTKLTEKTSEINAFSQKLATVRTWQASQALQDSHQRDKRISSEQIESVCTGILTTLSNILKLLVHYEVFEEPFHVVESLADTVLAVKVPENETTALRTSNFRMYVKKTEKWNVTKFFSTQKHCQNCFYPTLNVNSIPSLPANAPISTMFCEFVDDPFPWLNYGENSLTQVVGFRMTGVEATGDGIEIPPDAVEVYLIRKNLSFGTFNLTVGPSSEPYAVDESLRKTTGAFSFVVDCTAGRDVLIHIMAEVSVLFTVSVYAGRAITPNSLMTSYLVPHEIPPIANESDLFDPECPVKQARVLCLPAALLQVIAQRTASSECTVGVLLQAPRFVLKPNNKLVRISVFSSECLDMFGIQSDWREDTCIVGERTTWQRVHCVCKNLRRAKRQLDIIEQANLHLRTHYLTAKVIVVPNPVDLQVEAVKNITPNLVTLFTVLLILLLYLVLAFWALHRDETDQYLRNHVIVLLDNDPYDNVCYLVTVFTGSRCGSGTRANVFIQLHGTEGSSDVHCLSHPQFTTLYRGSICTFLLATKKDLGDIHSLRVWHNNEGRSPEWYLSRIKVENLFSRHIWLFMCREWLSIDTSLDRTFHVTPPDKPLKKMDFFLIDLSYKLRRSHLWFSVFSGVISAPFNRFQRLSCCLAVLLSMLMCNIMFFNLEKENEGETQEWRFIELMVIGLLSAFITLPVQLVITSLFMYSQRRPQVTLSEVTPRKHPLKPPASEHWEERLGNWHAYEIAKASSQEPVSKRHRAKPKASVKVTSKRQPLATQAESKVSHTKGRNINTNNPNIEDNTNVSVEKQPSQPGLASHKEKSRIVLPRWCVCVAWVLVFLICSISSFIIIFYGLGYSYEKSIAWLFASFCAFILSVFLVQMSTIIFISAYRTSKAKYGKNLSWIGNYRFTEIKLHNTWKDPEEMQRSQAYVMELRNSRMYQPLTQDEITIFKRKKRIKRRAFLFLSYILTHFIFLALLLSLVTILRPTDSFYYNQFIRDQFSVDLAGVTRLEDIYQWLNGVLLPLLHNDPNPTFLPDSSSKILGLPLMRQVRAQPGEITCLPAKKFVEGSLKGEIRCHPEYGMDPEDTKNYSGSWNKVSKRDTDKTTKGFTYKPPEKRWAYTSHGLLHTYGSGGYAFYFFPAEQQFNSTLRLSELQKSHWLDEKTWSVIVELTTFNPDISLLCSISVIFEVSQLGVVNTSLNAHSFSLTHFSRKYSADSAENYLYLAIFIFFLAYTVVEVYVITQERTAYVQSVCNLLNFALKCIFTLWIVLFFRKHFLAIGVVQAYLSNPEDFIPFHAVAQVDHTMKVILGFLVFLTILKMLRYSRVFYDVRLAQRAIQTALPGICHMALVLSVYFFVFMAFGYLVFGQHEWNYSDMIHATQTVVSYCVSAFQNTEFFNNWVLGILFLSSFVLVMICILINLFRAVILSAYKEMKQPVYEEPSEEVEAMTYLCRRLRSAFCCLCFKPRAEDEPKFLINMVYGHPEKNSRHYLGLKTRNINGKKMVYLVV